ncbi:MAG: CoA transferase [Pseudomonadota bacterium]
MTDPKKSNGPLAGYNFIEIAGIGPAPLCCSLLSDMGADVIRIDRPNPTGLGSSTPAQRRTFAGVDARPSLSTSNILKASRLYFDWSRVLMR